MSGTVDLHVERVKRTEPHVILDGVTVWLDESREGVPVDVWRIDGLHYRENVVDEAGAGVAVLAAVWESLLQHHPEMADAWLRDRVAERAAQPAPAPTSGDVWQELIEAEADPALRTLYVDRRAVGVARYGVPLQRDNGRDTARDLREELLDGMAYAQALGRPDVVAALRALLDTP